MWIKICGTTNLEDAQLAVDLGADALGFIFAPSRRRVSPQQVAAISAYLPGHVERIGVFTSGEPDDIASIARDAGLTGVQLHAQFSPGFRDALAHRTAGSLSITPTVHWTVDAAAGAPLPSGTVESSAGKGNNASSVSVREQLAALAAQPWPGQTSRRVLLDSRVGDALGGTGISFPWRTAADAIEAARDGLELIVAGGLHPGNVADAIRALAPWGIDVTSGVEQEPGRKDPEKLQMFIAQARAAADLLQAGPLEPEKHKGQNA